jgi:ubiquinone/menaquinone biosynthesis C-methylase UbiE
MTKPNLIKRLISFLRPALTPKMLARQLRQPSGKLGEAVGKKMNESNAYLYDFVFDAMKIKDNQNILEIGYGNGMFFDKLFSIAENLKVSGIDFSRSMFKTAQKNNEEAIVSDILDLRFGDCDVLPFDTDAFDKVFCINVVYFWENPMDNLMEIHRVLKPGGKFYTGIRDKDSMNNMPFTQYGFAMYDEESWKTQLVRNLFSFEETFITEEPPIEFNGEYFTPKSLCLVAQKPL